MKKIISLLLAFTMLCSMAMFTSCGGSSKGCTICGKEASHTFQGSKYCTSHYKDAIVWSMTHN